MVSRRDKHCLSASGWRRGSRACPARHGPRSSPGAEACRAIEGRGRPWGHQPWPGGDSWRRPRPACGRRASLLHIHVPYTHATSLWFRRDFAFRFSGTACAANRGAFSLSAQIQIQCNFYLRARKNARHIPHTCTIHNGLGLSDRALLVVRVPSLRPPFARIMQQCGHPPHRTGSYMHPSTAECAHGVKRSFA